MGIAKLELATDCTAADNIEHTQPNNPDLHSPEGSRCLDSIADCRKNRNHHRYHSPGEVGNRLVHCFG